MKRVTVAELLGDVLHRDPQEFGKHFALSKANGVEPMDVAKLAILSEQAFHLTLPDEDIAAWETLGDAAVTVERLLEAGDAEPLTREEKDRTAWFYE